MKPKRPCGAAAVWSLLFCALVPCMSAQGVTSTQHNGVVQDWSHNHIVFSRAGLAQHPDVVNRESRVLQQAMQRWQAPRADRFLGEEGLLNRTGKVQAKRDWNITGLGGHVAFNMFPAKFSFDPTAPPDCVNDFVVFGLNLAGTTGAHGNLVGLNNLYSGVPAGLCGSAPTALFSYNTTTVAGGRIITSPVLSQDGKKIAFVESVPGASSIFHVLTWTAGQGTLASSATPGAMTSLTISAVDNDTTSSPWIDYGNDVAYVGADDGAIYKITGVFHGTPAMAGAPWPVTASAGLQLTSPVLDQALGVVMVGSTNGNLYRINAATGARATRGIGAGTTHGIVAPPIVDVTNGTTFVVTANDGTSGVLVEVDTATMTVLAKARLGIAAASATAMHIYQPAFSNDYFNDPSTGQVHVCGTGAADTSPWQYTFGFTGRFLHTTPSFSQQLLTSVDARCTGWTEFFNANVAGGTDYFFFGLTQDCGGVGTAFGCVAEITGSNPNPLTVQVNGGPSGIVIDNDSAAAQASSIYLTAERANTLYKFTEQGLN